MGVWPDYRKSIVNLMSSIARGYGVRLEYEPLDSLPGEELREANNIVLLVIDGLGAEWLKREAGKESIFVKSKRGEITSVFPSTTTSGITTFLTGEGPQEHGLISWYMNLKEIGGIGAVLPWRRRGGGKIKAEGKGFFEQRSFFEKIKAKGIKVKSYCIEPKEIINSEFNKKLTKGAKQLGYYSLKGMFYQIRAVLKRGGKKFIYAYWPEFDDLAHHYGPDSIKVKKHFREIEKELEGLVKVVKGTKTILIVTADHGMIGTEGKEINLNGHREFLDCLSSAVCGEARVAFCYVRPDKIKQFEKYTGERLGKYCEMFKSNELVEKEVLGRKGGKKHEKLKERIGDYVLIAKENYVFRDFILGEKVRFLKGNHGGLSEEEMKVVVVINGF